MMPWERPLLVIGYKYNSSKVLSIFATSAEGITTLGIPYLYKYPDQFSNVSILPVARPLLMSKLFGLINEMDSHTSHVSRILHCRSSG